MKLVTKEIEKKFKKFPLYSQDGKGLEAEVVVKYFGGAATWLITEGEKKEDGDWELFGYITIGYGWEWGYVMLSELENLRFPPFGFGVERDLYCGNGRKVKELAQ